MPAFADRVQETATATIGAGNATLAGAVANYQSCNSAFGLNKSFVYTIQLTTQWEVGLGHLSSSTTLVRDKVLSSSTGSLVTFSAGTATIFADFSARDAATGTLGRRLGQLRSLTMPT